MRKVVGESDRHTFPLDDGTFRVEITSLVAHVEGYGNSETEAAMAAERAYDEERERLFVTPGRGPAAEALDAAADCLRMHQTAMVNGGSLPAGLPVWAALTMSQQEMWRAKAEHYMNVRSRPPEPEQVRGRDMGGARII